MSLTYTGPSGLFTLIGTLIGRANSYAVTGTTTLPTDRDTILGVFGATGQNDAPIEGLISAYEGYRSATTSWRTSLAAFIDRVMTDPNLVQAPLNLPSNDLTTILKNLLWDMNYQSQTVQASAVVLGSPTAQGTPAGNGSVLLTPILDGYSPPTQGAFAHPLYNGQTTQLCVPAETMTLLCVADAVQDGLSEGSENFQWYGGPPSGDQDYRAEGSGNGPTIQVMNGDATVQNGDFELWSANVPNSWTLAAGTAGTHVFQEVTAANVYRGANSLKLTGAGGQGTIQLTQAVNPSSLKALRRYCLSVRVQATQSFSSGNLAINFQGTGYTPSASEMVNVSCSMLPGSWNNAPSGLYSFFINLPKVIPANWALSLALTGTPTNGQSVWIDSLAFAPVNYFGGLGAVAIAGSKQFTKGDRFTFAISNNTAGIFQNFFRRHFQVQLPSAATNPTIADALAS